MAPEPFQNRRWSRRDLLRNAALASTGAGLLLSPSRALSAGNSILAPSRPLASTQLAFAVDTSPAALTALDAVFQSFQKSAHNITMKEEPAAGSIADYLQKLQVETLGNDAPDLWDMFSYTAYFVHEGLPAPLDGLMKQDPVDTSIFPQDLVQPWRYKGKLYALPSSQSFSVLAYNADMLSAAGVPKPPSAWGDDSWTLDAFINAAKKATRRDSSGHFVQFGSTGLGNIYLQTVLFGAQWLTKDLKSNMLSPEFINALSKIQSMVTVDKIQPTNSELNSIAAAGDPFLGGKAAFTTVTGPAVATYLTAPFKWDFAPMPKITSGPAFGWLFPDAISVMSKSQHKTDAWKFIKWLCNVSNEEAYATAFGRLPVTRTGAAQWAKKVKNARPELHTAIVTDLLAGRGKPENTTNLEKSIYYYDIQNQVITPLQTDLLNGAGSAKALAHKYNPTMLQILNGSA